MFRVTVLLLLLTLFITISVADLAPPGLDLFYNYSTFCPHPSPSIHTPILHLCVASSDGPFTKIDPALGTYSVFENPTNKSQFVVVLWSDYSTAKVETKGHTVTVLSGDQQQHKDCVEFHVENATGQVLDVGLNFQTDGEVGFAVVRG